jgi:hypothetical protein
MGVHPRQLMDNFDFVRDLLRSQVASRAEQPDFAVWCTKERYFMRRVMIEKKRLIFKKIAAVS